MKHVLLIVIGILFLFSLAAPAMPCCMVPKTYSGTISQTAQEAILFHHGDREELIIKINYKLSEKTAPEQFAWIITVPNEPDKYALADNDLFKEMFEWAEPKVERPTKRAHADNEGEAQDEKRGLEFGKKAVVGPYEIQPIRALGADALKGMNEWLETNGFPTEDPEHMLYFVENKFTFLCIKINAETEGAEVDVSGEIPPLHLSFESKEAYYPLRFSSRQGVFDVNLYVFSGDKLDYEKSKSTLEKIYWMQSEFLRNVEVKTKDFPAKMKASYKKFSLGKKTIKTWYLNVVRTQATNRNNSIAKWDSDVFFSVMK